MIKSRTSIHLAQASGRTVAIGTTTSPALAEYAAKVESDKASKRIFASGLAVMGVCAVRAAQYYRTNPEG